MQLMRYWHIAGQPCCKSGITEWGKEITVNFFPSRKLRSRIYGRVLLNSYIALLGFHFVFVAASLKGTAQLSDVMCGIFSALLHYFMLVYFFWTAAELLLIYLELEVFEIDTSHYALKAAIVSYSKLYPSHMVVISSSSMHWPNSLTYNRELWARITVVSI